MNCKYLKVIALIVFLLPTGWVSAQDNPSASGPETVIRGTFQSDIGDTVILTVWNDLFSYSKRYFVPNTQYKCPANGGKFSFRLGNLSHKVYISIGARGGTINKGGNPFPLLDIFLLEKGDNVEIRETKIPGHPVPVVDGSTKCSDCSAFSFSGPGSAKFQCTWELVQSRRKMWNKGSKDFIPTEENSLFDKARYSFDQNNKVIKNGLIVLEKYKSSVREDIFQILRTDLYASTGWELFSSISISIPPTFEKEYKADDIEKTKGYFKDKAPVFLSAFKGDKSQLFSAYYPEMQIIYTGIEAKLSQGDRYTVLKSTLKGVERDRALAGFFFVFFPNMKDMEKNAGEALSFMQSNNYREVVNNVLRQQRVGTKVYDFALSDSSGKIVRLSDFKGKVVFIDFFFVGCSGCSYYFQDKLSFVEEHFKDSKDIAFITISIDADKNKWIKGLKSGIYTSDRAVNLNTGKEGIRHPVIKQLLIQSYPSPLLIDREGKIAINDNEMLHNASKEELISTLQNIISAKN